MTIDLEERGWSAVGETGLRVLDYGAGKAGGQDQRAGVARSLSAEEMPMGVALLPS